MMLCRVEGSIVATIKNEHLKGKKILSCRPVAVDGKTAIAAAFLAIDRVKAGPGDLVLVINEGSSARLVFDNPKIPVVSFITAVVDALDIVDESTLVGCSVVERQSEAGGEA